jgi:hypothetical protein
MLVETPGAIPWSESFPYQITFTSIAFGFAVWKFGILFSTNYIDVGCNIALVCSRKRWDWRTLSAERDYHGARPANKPPRSKRWWWLFSYWHCIEKPGELIAQLRFQPVHDGRRNPQYSGRSTFDAADFRTRDALALKRPGESRPPPLVPYQYFHRAPARGFSLSLFMPHRPLRMQQPC